MRLRVPRKYRTALGAAVVVAVFVTALVAWVGRDQNQPNYAGLSATAAAPAPNTTSEGEVAASKSAGRSPTDVTPTPSGHASLPPLSLPSTSIDANSSGAPQHSITMKATSDQLIAGFGYLVRGGKPGKYGKYYVKSPAVVHTTGRSYGAVAEVIAQAGYGATYVTCTLTVDGVVRAHQTAHGAYKFAVCSG